MSYRNFLKYGFLFLSTLLSFGVNVDSALSQTSSTAKAATSPALPWITSISSGAVPDTVLVSTATGLPLRPSQVALSKLSSPQEMTKLGETEASAWKILLLEDKNRFLVADYAGNYYVGSLADAAQWKKLEFKSRWSRALCNLEGQIVAGTEDGKLVTASTADLAFTAPVDAHQGAVFSIRASSDRKTFLSASGDGTVKIWNAADKAMVRSISVGPQAVWDAVFVLGDKMIVTGDADRRVNLYDAATGKLQMSLESFPIGQPPWKCFRMIWWPSVV